jgi:hypothetical protein
MGKPKLKRGDRVEWSYRGRTVTGTVRRRLTERTEVGGRMAAATKENPRYVVRTDTGGREVAHRAEALKPISG